jgi:Tropinone reductase 1
MITILSLLVVLLIDAVYCSSIAPVPVADRWSLKGKNIVVTGGSKGIGKSIVEELLSLGARVLTCSRNGDDLNECLAIWESNGFSNVEGVACDVSSVEGRAILTQECHRQFGESCIHALVNNVGSNVRKKSVEYDEADFDFVMKTNLQSAFFLSTSLHPLLKASGGM